MRKLLVIALLLGSVSASAYGPDETVRSRKEQQKINATVEVKDREPKVSEAIGTVKESQDIGGAPLFHIGDVQITEWDAKDIESKCGSRTASVVLSDGKVVEINCKDSN